LFLARVLLDKSICQMHKCKIW